MIRDIFNQGILFYVIAGICLLGILSRFVLNCLFRKFRKESVQIATTKNKLIRQIRLKYENAYRANSGVNNIQALVDKYMNQYKFLGLRLHSFRKLTEHCILLCILLGGVGAGASYWLNESLYDVLLYGAWTAGAVLLLGLSIYLFHENYSKNVMLANVMDYLDNTLANRLRNECDAEAEVKAERRRQQVKRKMEEEEEGESIPETEADFEEEKEIAAAVVEKPVVKKFKKKAVEEDINQMKKSLDQIAADSEDKQQERRKVSKEEQQAIVEEILREYLS